MAKTFKIINPFNQEIIGEINYINAEDIQDVINRLIKGKEIQNKSTPFDRAEILLKLAGLIKENAELLAKAVSLETGKTIRDCRTEALRAIATITCSAEEARRINGEILNSAAYNSGANKSGLVYWKPLGIVVAITPFNMPLNIAAHKIGPAYAAGNTIFFKPSPQNYLSSLILTKLCYQAGIPEDVLQLCMADIAELQTVIKHPEVNCINFTGGVKTGMAIANQAGFKKLLMELGGNDPLIVMEDADLELAAKTAVNQRFFTAGQRCTAAKRLFVHEKVYSEFSNILLELTNKLVIGDPEDEKTDLGPVVSENSANSIMHAIETAIKDGATVLSGNKREGNIIYPTILENVSDTSYIVCEEVFGPVIPLRKFKDLEEVILLVNNSPFGLQAGIFTNQMDKIKYLFDKLEVGLLAVNDGPGFRAEHFPFGGVKDSGTGREGIAYAIREMSYQKTLVF